MGRGAWRAARLRAMLLARPRARATLSLLQGCRVRLAAMRPRPGPGPCESSGNSAGFFCRCARCEAAVRRTSWSPAPPQASRQPGVESGAFRRDFSWAVQIAGSWPFNTHPFTARKCHRPRVLDCSSQRLSSVSLGNQVGRVSNIGQPSVGNSGCDSATRGMSMCSCTGCR